MEYLKKIRTEISIFINSVSLLTPSREISLVKINLERTMMFLGLCLKYDGNSTPYPESENPQNDKIEPQADRSELTLLEYWVVLPNTQTAKVKDFRAKIESVISSMYAERRESIISKPDYCYSLFFDQAFVALSEAKMWLGMELGRLLKEM